MRMAILITVATFALTGSAFAQSDRYDELARLPMNGGYPTAATSRTLDDELYFQRAVQTYLWALPVANMYAIYPLNGRSRPMEFPHASNVPSNALFAHDASYFEMLDRMIQSEQLDAVDPYMHGVLAAIGIRKDQYFNPTRRQRELLDDAAQTAWKMAKNIAANFDRHEDGLWWEDRQWVAHARTELNDFMRTLLDEEYRDRETGYTDVDAKAHMFINHFSISTGMISSVVGLGAKYAGAYKDSNGNYLRGEDSYTIDLPPNPPAKLFWSLTLYDAETASGVNAPDQEYPSLNSMNDLVFNDDGTITFHIGPEQPDDAKNFIKTVPGRGWFALIRWYGPEQAFFDREYKPGDFEKTNSP